MQRPSFRNSFAFAAAVASSLLLCSARALAADVGIIATAPSNDVFATKLGQELEQLGFSVTRERELMATSREGPRWMLIRVLDDGRAIELYDVASQKRERRSTAADPLKAAEEVRALLLPLIQAAAPPIVAAPVTTSPTTTTTTTQAEITPIAPAKAAPSRLELALGGGAVFGGTTPGVAIDPSVRFFPRALHVGRTLSIGGSLGGVIPIAAESVERSEGSTNVRAYLAGGEVIARLLILRRALDVDLGLGLFAAHVSVEGQANAPFTSRSDSAWSLAPAARSGLQFHVTDALAIYVAGRIGMASPAVAVRHAGGTTHEWGAPFGMVSTGVTLGF